MTTERQMLDLVHQRFSHVYNGVSPRYVIAEHVQLNPSGGSRILDAIVADMWRSDGYAMHGIEVKCSRSDLKRELDDPTKAAAFTEHLDYFWLVVSSDAVLACLRVPNTWGILIPGTTGLRARRAAPRLRKVCPGYAPLEPMTRALQVAMLRATRKTYERHSAVVAP